MKIIERIHNIESGQVTDVERDATPQEIAETREAQAKAEAQAIAEAKVGEKRAALIEKLGITEEEAKLLLG